MEKDHGETGAVLEHKPLFDPNDIVVSIEEHAGRQGVLVIHLPILENPVTFRPHVCRFCGKRRAYFVPELGKGYAHLECWKQYLALKKSERE